MHENSQSPLQPLALPGAWDPALLAPVAEINQQMLEYLRGMAEKDSAQSMTQTPKLVSELREHWRALDVRSLRRLSGCPYLLLDGAFAQAARWQTVLGSGVMDAPLRAGYFTGSAGAALIRRTLLLAWHLARSNRLMASVVLGMNAASAERIALTRLQDLETLAELAPAWIAPRWAQQPIVWQQMIRAACAEEPLALRLVQWRGVQLLASPYRRS
jgi:hypothetical protein